MGSIANDENLELWAFAAPVLILRSIGRVFTCQSSTANLELCSWSCGFCSNQWQNTESLCSSY